MALDIPFNGCRVEGCAIMELHAFAEFEDIRLRVPDLPGLGELGLFIQILIISHQGIVDRKEDVMLRPSHPFMRIEGCGIEREAHSQCAASRRGFSRVRHMSR